MDAPTPISTSPTTDQVASGQRMPLRLTMTLPGSASLGAYQAGAVSALAVVIATLRKQGTDLRVDAIGGSSAGAIVAMLFSHCLLTGRDTCDVMRAAWIDEVDLDLLRDSEPDAPLTLDDLDNKLREFLGDYDRLPAEVHEPLSTPIHLEVGLTNLLGFTEEVSTPSGGTSALSYVDWAEFDLEPGHSHRRLFEPDRSSLLDTVLTSAAHPAAFRPRKLDRTAARQGYEDRGIVNFPEHGQLWYTDGGLIESRPIGRIITAARRFEGDAGAGTRLHLVVDPRSSGPSGVREWKEPGGRRSWIDGLRRAVSILPTQGLHDDLRRVADTNRRIQRLDELTDELGGRFDLQGDDLKQLRSDLADLADVAGKEIVDVEMISPLLLAEPDGDGVNDLLAGDFVGAFGGFLDAAIRRSDFALGWRCTTAWADDSLAELGVGQEAVDAVQAALDKVKPSELRDASIDGDGVDALEPSGRWKLALLAGRFGRVLVSEAIPDWPAVLDRFRVGRDAADAEDDGDRSQGSRVTSGGWLGPLARFEPGRTADGSSIFLERGVTTGFAHRGDRSGRPPGNHWSAFEAALDAGINHIESDVHLTADGELVLFHDDMLDDETTANGPIRYWSWAALSEVRYRHGDRILEEGLVRLGDALERWPGVRWNIDAKHDEAVEPLMQLIADTGSGNRLLVTSFGQSTMRRIRLLAPPALATGVAGPEVAAIKAASILGLPSPTFGDAVQVPVEHRGVTIVDERFLQTCHRAGMAVHVWTINDQSEMGRLLDLGVDGIMSDDPALLKTALDRHHNDLHRNHTDHQDPHPRSTT